MKESEILDQIRKEVGMGLHAGFVLWRVNQLVATVNGQKMRGGMVDGASDFIGIVKMSNGTGRFVGLEVKKPKTGRQSKVQKLFQNLVQSLGGYYALVTSVEEARQAIADARAEIGIQNEKHCR